MTNTEIIEDILTRIRNGATSWKMPWYRGLEMPVNAITHIPYKGRNADILWKKCIDKQYTFNRWATLKQWSKVGARIRRGQKGTRILTPKIGMAADMFIGESNALTGFYQRHVFNEAQVTNYDDSHPDLFYLETQLDDQYDLLNALILKSGADIRYGGEKAYYSPRHDYIGMPERYRFFDKENASATASFYATLFHELIHWTNQNTRCNRPSIGDDLETIYAFEELVAELGSVLICSSFKQTLVPREQNAAYLALWLRALENDEGKYFEALKYAQTAVEWLYEKTGVQPSNWAMKTENAAPRKAKPVSHLRIVGTKRNGFRSSQRINVICGHCDVDYELTVSRYEDYSVCPECLGVNLHPLDWD